MASRIADLPKLVAGLPGPDRGRFERLFAITSGEGRLVPPPQMVGWIARQFGSIEAVERQPIVRVTNRWTWEGTLFNCLRGHRPAPTDGRDLEAQIEASRGDAFCDVETRTPADVFGRVRGNGVVTAANVAKYETWCAVVVFDEHHPLRISEQGVGAAIETAWRWGQEVHRADPPARYWFFMWNGLWRAGASIVHGHAQTASTRESHFPHVERWRAAARRYGAGYFEDLFRAHESLGLAFEHNSVRVLAHLTPLREKETLLIAPSLGPALTAALYQVLTTFIHDLGVTSFNVGLYHRPLGRPTWPTFPVVLRIVDRGDNATRNSDVGAMELFAASVSAGDPFETVEALRARLRTAESC